VVSVEKSTLSTFDCRFWTGLALKAKYPVLGGEVKNGDGATHTSCKSTHIFYNFS
jgi:hypothetical protein